VSGGFKDAVKDLVKHVLDNQEMMEEFKARVDAVIEYINSRDSADARGELFFYVLSRLTSDVDVPVDTAVATLEAAKFTLLLKVYSFSVSAAVEVLKRFGFVAEEGESEGE